MVAGKKRDAQYYAARARESQKKAFKSHYQFKAQVIKDQVKANPDRCIPRLYQCLVDLGFAADDITGEASPVKGPSENSSVASSPGNSPSPPSPPQPSPSSAQDKPPQSTVKIFGKVIDIKLDPKTKFFINVAKPAESLSVHQWGYVMTKVDKVLTEHALEALKPTPRKAVPLTSMYEVAEGIFDLSPTSEVPADCETLDDVVAFLLPINEANGRRATKFTLSPKKDWEPDGCYKDGSTHLVSNWDSTPPVEVTTAILGLPKDRSLTKLRILQNFSKNRAILAYKGAFKEWLCVSVVSSSVAANVFQSDSPPSKRQRIQGKQSSQTARVAVPVKFSGQKIILEHLLEPPILCMK